MMLPIYFVSLGMLFEPSVLLHWRTASIVVSGFLVVVVLKFSVGFVLAILNRLRLRTAIRFGSIQAHTGELSFVLATIGQRSGIISPEQYNIFVAIAVMTLLLSYRSIILGSFVSKSMPDLALLSRRILPERANGDPVPPHVVIVGYGFFGKVIARIMRSRDIEVVIIERNPQRVALAKQDGYRNVEHSINGADIQIFRKRGILDNAMMVVLAFDIEVDLIQAIKDIRLLRREKGPVKILARAHQADEALHIMDENDPDLFVVVQSLEAALRSTEVVLQQIGATRLGDREDNVLITELFEEQRC